MSNISMSFFSKLRMCLRRRYYVIGYGSFSDINVYSNEVPSHITWVRFNNYKTNWLADPYILAETDTNIEFLVEEWIENEHKGRLAKLSFDKKHRKVLYIKTILDLSSHLSFPSIVKENNRIYVCPENAASGKQKIYEYNTKKAILENPVTIINESLLDVNIVKIDHCYYAFGIRLLQNDQGDNCRLRIYKSDVLLGRYVLYQEITSDLAQERGAGAFFWYDGKLVRPVQNCEGDYGRNVIFKEILLKDNIFEEKVIGSLFPTNQYPEGLHTFNVQGDTYVIDGMGYNAGKWMTYLKRCLHK